MKDAKARSTRLSVSVVRRAARGSHDRVIDSAASAGPLRSEYQSRLHLRRPECPIADGSTFFRVDRMPTRDVLRSRWNSGRGMHVRWTRVSGLVALVSLHGMVITDAFDTFFVKGLNTVNRCKQVACMPSGGG